jgi:hypothetical protein
MSAAQERLFFQFLRESLRPEQVVLLSTDRVSTEAFADEVKYLGECGNASGVAGVPTASEDRADT